MATTETGDLVNVGWDGDVPETAITNAMASEPGFPARKADGELVLIVKQYAEGTDKVLEDADGNKYVDDHVSGRLIDYDAAQAVAVEPEAEEAVEADEPDATEDVFGHVVEGEEAE